ncbi:ATP-binding protein [Streptomyces sp. bgisy027]|uniref:ATP-binding protein n=1 Tax=Streptomyces sp. bgisy027 TaxID=3413770 RepID=UPI003D702AE5
MTARPSPVVCAVDWTPLPILRPVPAHGTALRLPEPRYEQRLCESRTLPGRARTTPAAARSHVDGTCRTWRVPHEVRDALLLIVSELTTNAVIHGAGAEVVVTVLLSPAHVWVVVDEQGRAAGSPRLRGPIRPRTAGDDAEDGRGLHLVEALAARYQVTATSTGTRAWACLNLPARRASAQGPSADHSPTQDGTNSPHPEDNDVPRSHT